jgi:hypothetical protein
MIVEEMHVRLFRTLKLGVQFGFRIDVKYNVPEVPKAKVEEFGTEQTD